ncbi:hypothetical protein ONS95_003576 [Cadophora gregata]|uniref:uncharacterized protein n=1 Tax=Cadophora gregata TaxID=51156 RepID=UPI0026DC19A1|nr:uncharacterized protein ONS95_003576 [Cadophora gregata]KAK0106854.1 hypothetical protein ONS95_003576 [Cadophora gregata]
MGSISEPPKTYGTFRYITKGIKPIPSTHFYHLPSLSEFNDIRSLPLIDIRPSLSLGPKTPYKLSTHGFTAVYSPSILSSPPCSHQDWSNEELLKSTYIPETEALLQRVTGAKAVLTDSLVMRRTLHSEVDGLAREESEKEMMMFLKMVGTKAGSEGSPAPKVHLDYSPSGARTHLRKYHPKTKEFAKEILEAEDRLLAEGIKPEEIKDRYQGSRWAMFSVWRPLKRVLRDPLALSDGKTFPREDYVEFEVRVPSGVRGEEEEKGHPENVYLAYGSDSHEWFWIEKQEPDEVLVIQLFDSDAEKEGRGGAGGVMHSSVSIEGTENEEARESVEVRCIAIW